MSRRHCARHGKDRARVIRGNLPFQRGQRDGPVEAAGVDVEEARLLRAPPRDRALSHACGAVNCHDHGPSWSRSHWSPRNACPWARSDAGPCGGGRASPGLHRARPLRRWSVSSARGFSVRIFAALRRPRLCMVEKPAHLALGEPAEVTRRNAAEGDGSDAQAMHPLQADVAAGKDVPQLPVLAFRERDVGRVRAPERVGLAAIDDIANLDPVHVTPQEIVVDFPSRSLQGILSRSARQGARRSS